MLVSHTLTRTSILRQVQEMAAKGTKGVEGGGVAPIVVGSGAWLELVDLLRSGLLSAIVPPPSRRITLGEFRFTVRFDSRFKKTSS
jgi:hypothetical protein